MRKIVEKNFLSDRSLSLLIDIISKGERRVNVGGLQGAAKAFLLSALFRKTAGSLVVVAATENDARQWRRDLSFFLGEDQVFFYPLSDIRSTNIFAFQKDAALQRMEILGRLFQCQPMVVVLPVNALMQKAMPRSLFAEYGENISLGDFRDRDGLAEKLNSGGYSRVSLVEEKGEFSVRGSIVDIFPPATGSPLRLEFVGDELESVRTFEPASQRSREEITDFLLLPAGEVLLSPERKQRAVANIKRRASELELPGPIRNRLIESVVDGPISSINPLFLPLFYESVPEINGENNQKTAGGILDYLSDDSLLVFDDFNALKQAGKQRENDIDQYLLKARKEETFYLERETSYIAEDQIFARCEEFPQVFLENFGEAMEGDSPVPLVRFTTEKEIFTGHAWKAAAASDAGPLCLFAEDIKKRLDEGNLVFFLSAGQEEAQRMTYMLSEYGLSPALSTPASFFAELADHRGGGKLILLDGHLSGGFHFPALKLSVITEEDIFGRKITRRRIRPPREGYFLRSFGELSDGDYVVHTDHGIGLYRGLQKLSAGGLESDFLLLEYQGADKLYIPVDRLDRIQRYAGPEGYTPPLDKLGSSSWDAVKERVKKSVREVAEELVAICAARQVMEGHSFFLPRGIYDEFCAGFEFEETPDQAGAIADVELDLRDKKPMDRLICGDAGFGKTEVALRASFVAAMEGKQVAVLVPTTILAEQHYQTFSRRLEDWPLRVEVINRFKTKAEQRKIAEDMAQGTVDIVIGTHRLLQKDIAFKDLGLVVIDEEQRFGVTHKEKLKKLRTLVDVLTLTATPIPRTLHLAMSGIRDLSVINTPPEDRLPVKTYVMEFDGEVIKDAIQGELTRGGRVFFLHDRVRSIYSMARFVEKLVPGARVGVVHGRMKAKEVEETMAGFVRGDCDVLVCTTIIGAGLDIPTANTIIINRADRFGLAQLYQIRGRVGRSRDEGRAYLLVPKGMMLSPDARKRLQVIVDFSEPGSGFRISYQDLEIRGGGNILGTSQSGHISAVGFELYTELMEQTLRELKGEEIIKEEAKPEIHLGVPAFIPEEYMTDVRRRLITYKRLSLAGSEEDIASIRTELIDCYGFLPSEVGGLMEIIGIRNMLHSLRGKKMVYDGRNMVISFHRESTVDPGRILELARKKWPGIKLTPNLQLHVPMADLTGGEILREAKGLLRVLMN